MCHPNPSIYTPAFESIYGTSAPPSRYRLCRKIDGYEATEECFQKTPLEFDRTKQMLVWNTKEVPVKDE